MFDPIEDGLFALTKAFSPSDVQKLGEDSRRIILSIVELGKKPVPFSLDDLVQYAKENFTPPVPIDNMVVDDILAKLEQQKLIEQPTLGNYTISILSRESINEFFSLCLQPRLGKTTRFSNYLLMDKNKLREVQWCCIYLSINNIPFAPKKIVEISQLIQGEARENLREMVNRDQLKKDFTWVKNKQEELFHELFWDYWQNYRDSKPTIKDFVFQIILRHSNISREEIQKHLRNQGIVCSKRMVQKALAGLINDNMIRRIGLENSGDNKVDYELSPECTDLCRRSRIKEIAVILKNVGFQVEDEFFDELKKQSQSLSSINTFLYQLSFLIVQSEDEAESCQLWQTFFSNLNKKSFPASIADSISNSPEADQLEELEKIVKSSGISPAALCLIKYFQSTSNT